MHDQNTPPETTSPHINPEVTGQPINDPTTPTPESSQPLPSAQNSNKKIYVLTSIVLALLITVSVIAFFVYFKNKDKNVTTEKANSPIPTQTVSYIPTEKLTILSPKDGTVVSRGETVEIVYSASTDKKILFLVSQDIFSENYKNRSNQIEKVYFTVPERATEQISIDIGALPENISSEDLQESDLEQAQISLPLDTTYPEFTQLKVPTNSGGTNFAGSVTEEIIIEKDETFYTFVYGITDSGEEVEIDPGYEKLEITTFSQTTYDQGNVTDPDSLVAQAAKNPIVRINEDGTITGLREGQERLIFSYPDLDPVSVEVQVFDI